MLNGEVYFDWIKRKMSLIWPLNWSAEVRGTRKILKITTLKL